MRDIHLHHPGHQALVWVTRDRSARYYMLFWFAVVLSVAVFGALAFYEWRVLGENRLGIDSRPHITLYHLGRLAIAAVLSAVIILPLYHERAPRAGIEHGTLSPPHHALALGLNLMAAAFAILFLVDSAGFNWLSLEDQAVEWLSAILPFVFSFVLLHGFIVVLRAPQRDLRRSLALIATAGSAIVLFLLAMEEVSWMQRIFHIETPEMFAANQQHEMNFHNMHTYVVGTAHKLAGFACLILLPFIYDTAPAIRLLDLVSDFIPSRFVVAASAPMAGFNYNDWTFFPTQMTVVMTVLILAAYAHAARRRRDRREMALFAGAAAIVVAAQIVFLAWGANFVRLWDVTEYKEFYIAIGLSLFAWEATQRLRARYGSRSAA